MLKQKVQDWQIDELGGIFISQNKTGRKAGEGLEQGKYKFFTSSSKQTKFIKECDFDGEYLIFATGGQAGIHYCKGKFSASNDNWVVSPLTIEYDDNSTSTNFAFGSEFLTQELININSAINKTQLITFVEIILFFFFIDLLELNFCPGKKGGDCSHGLL